MEESTFPQAASRYCKVIEGYKLRLRANPELKLSEYCRESHTNYSGIIDWIFNENHYKQTKQK